MKQLFATLKRLDFHKELVLVGYEMVTLPDGAISSRKGNIVRYDELRDAMFQALVDSTKLRHPECKEKIVNTNALTIALAAMKFMMLRQDPGKILVFDMAEAMATDGFTGPYILYTIARINSLHGKTKISAFPLASALIDSQEVQLLRKVSEYPDVVAQAGTEMRPSLVCLFAFELAQMFSRYYAEVHKI